MRVKNLDLLNDESITNIITGANDFVCSRQSRHAVLCAHILSDLVAYAPSDPLLARRWEIITEILSQPDGFRLIVSDMISIARMRLAMRASGDPTGEISAQIEDLRASIASMADYVNATMSDA